MNEQNYSPEAGESTPSQPQQGTPPRDPSHDDYQAGAAQPTRPAPTYPGPAQQGGHGAAAGPQSPGRPPESAGAPPQGPGAPAQGAGRPSGQEYGGYAPPGQQGGHQQGGQRGPAGPGHGGPGPGGPGYGGPGSPGQGYGGPGGPGGPGQGYGGPAGPGEGPGGPGQPQQWQGGQAPAKKPADRGAQVRMGLHVLAALLIILGISLPLDGGTFWTQAWTWAGLTTIAALVQAVLLVPGDVKLSWQLAAGAAATLVLTWTLVFLPMVQTDRGFMVTLGTALAVAAVWLHPARKELT